jgi:glycogen(starch) synthase
VSARAALLRLRQAGKPSRKNDRPIRMGGKNVRILLASYVYSPSVGGIETSSRVLVDEWRRLGHEVTVVTETSGPDEPGLLRRPGWKALWQSLSRCDVFFQNNPSLRLARMWPLCPRPWVVTLQTWLCHPGWPVTRSVRLKRRSLFAAHCVAISRAVAAEVDGRAEVIPNPYDDRVFHDRDRQAIPMTIAFVGRLVNDKGADLAIEALALLGRIGITARLLIICDGPERAGLEELARARQLSDSVEMCGTLPPHEVAGRLRASEALIVPSRWPEPFGIVAIEGAACGCVVVGSDGGGLPEAIGPAGWTFQSGDAASLAEALAKLWREPAAVASARDAASAHVARHTAGAVAERYLELFRRVLPALREEGCPA